MVKNLRPLADKIDSVEFLNALRNNAGWDYQSRIPEATQANLSESIENIWSFQAGRNQVVDALINRIGLVRFNQMQWTNPLAEFKYGMLTQGETIEEVQVGLIKATDYDFDRDELEKEIFGNHPLEVQSRFHKVNRRDRYAFTVNLPGLRLALLNGELGSFTAQMMDAPRISDQWDEFLLMSRLFKEVDEAYAGSLHNVNVPDIADATSDGADSRYTLRRLREYSNTLPFISRLYNPAGMPIGTSPDDLILFVTPGADAAMDVEALAGAFNIDKAEFGSRKVILPDTAFGIPGTQAILTTRQFFVVADNLVETTSQFNPAKLTTNYWLHHWQVISASPFAPFVTFNSERDSTTITIQDYDVTDIGAFTITDKNGVVAATQVRRGMLYDVAVEAVTTPTGGPNDALDLDVSGHTSQWTYLTNNGDLFIGPDEDAESITITATAVDNSYTESTTRAVIGDQIQWMPPLVMPDSDSDALEEVTPVQPEIEGTNIVIPYTTGVQYKDGATNLNNGAILAVVDGTPKTITAVARAGKELATGADASWTFTNTAGEIAVS